MDTSSPGAGPRVAGFIVGLIGLVLGPAGFVVWHFVPGIVAAERARLEALPSPDAISLSDTPAGREVIVEGRIAPDQPARFRNFVAYVKEEEQRDKKERERTGNWKVVETATPPLHLIVGDGSVGGQRELPQIFAKTQWRDEAIIDTHYSGLVSGEAVFVRAPLPLAASRRRLSAQAPARPTSPRSPARRRRLFARRRLHGPRDAHGRHRAGAVRHGCADGADPFDAAAGTTGSSMKLAVGPAR